MTQFNLSQKITIHSLSTIYNNLTTIAVNRFIRFNSCPLVYYFFKLFYTYNRGIIPDHYVPQTFDDFLNNTDNQLNYTFELIKKKRLQKK